MHEVQSVQAWITRCYAFEHSDCTVQGSSRDVDLINLLYLALIILSHFLVLLHVKI
jgi:hypothetical protein